MIDPYCMFRVPQRYEVHTLHAVIPPALSLCRLPAKTRRAAPLPPLSGLSPRLHTGDSAGIAAPHGLGCQHLHAGTVNVRQSQHSSRSSKAILTAAALCMAGPHMTGLYDGLPAAVAPAAVRPPMFSAGASTVSFPYRCPVRSSFFRLWPPALSPASFVWLESARGRTAGWPDKLLCAMAPLPPRSASASIFAKMCTFPQETFLYQFIKSLAQKFLNFNTSRGNFSAESTLRKCTCFHIISTFIF